MKYVMMGSGGTGGCIGAFLQKAGHDVTFIARGAHLAAMQRQGLTVHSGKIGEFSLPTVQACTAQQYSGKPDVVFVCVKHYSLPDAISFCRSHARPDTVIIPILNVYGTGDQMQEQLPGLRVLSGCIYIFGMVQQPGVLLQKDDNFRVVFGERSHRMGDPVLEQIRSDLEESGMDVLYSPDIQRDTMKKFSTLSPYACTGSFYDVPAGAIQVPGAPRDTYLSMVDEVLALSDAMGIVFDEDMRTKNRDFLDSFLPDSTSSLHRDIKKGGKSELDGLLFQPVRWGRQYGVPTPTYEQLAKHFGFAEA